MPRRCTVCQHEKRHAIDKALVAGETFRRIAADFDVTEQAVRRHKSAHLPAALTKAQEAAEVAHADDVLAQVQNLRDRALGVLDKAERADDLRAAVSAIREARGCVELLAKLVGDLNEGATVNVLVSPEWGRVRGLVIEALAPHQEARAAVAAALMRLGDAGA